MRYLQRNVYTAFCLALAMLLITAPISAAETDLSQLTREQNVEFNRRRLAVSVQDTVSFFVYQGTGGGGTQRYVSHFQGFDRIREYRFFEIAGYQQEAENARRHHRVNTALHVSAWTLIGVGVVGLIGLIVVGSEPWPDFDDPNYDSIRADQDRREGIWATVAIGASLSGLIPAVAVLVRGEHRYTPGHAIQAADGYNRELLNDIRNR